MIDVHVSKRRNTMAARTFFTSIVKAHTCPEDVNTDLAAPLLRVVDELFSAAFHDTGQYANNRIENNHGVFGRRSQLIAARSQPGRRLLLASGVGRVHVDSGSYEDTRSKMCRFHMSTP